MSTIADDALRVISNRLEIDAGRFRTAHVIVDEGPSSVVDRAIRISSLPRDGYQRADWLELLFSHELTHLLVRDTWGTGPVLWWEGLPVHLGDDRVRTRLFGHSYHAYCRALDQLDALLPLEPLLQASTFYRRRADIRVDLQAGSFCGFLLETLGPRRLGAFLTDYRRPTRADPRMLLDPITKQHLGDDFAGLAEGWIGFLRARVPCEPELVDRLRTRTFGLEPDRREHCDFCFAPRSSDRACPCPDAGEP
ncbi:MAG: Peptidase superfamily [Deltaproteobacteria bacterium]|nr:Peptidase superfamily [Deltaproteobacteria bacterium]